MKNLKKITAFLFVSLIMTSCLVDDERPDLEEGNANTPYSVGTDISSDPIILTPADTETIKLDGNIILYGMTDGTYSPNDILVKYEIDASNEAVEGTMFGIGNTTNSFTIPAGREISTEMLNLELYPLAFPVGVDTKLVLNIVSADNNPNVQTGLPYGQINITISKCNPPLAGTYTASNTVNGSSNGDGETVIIKALGCDGTYEASNLPNFNGVFTWNFTFNSDLNTITVYGSLNNFGAGNEVIGSGVLVGGTFDPSSGVITGGVIQMSGFDYAAQGLNMSFDLTINP